MLPIARPLLVAFVLVPAVNAQDAIIWSKDLATAFEQAKAKKKIIMICVNAKYVDGKKTEESANKGLREVVYKDERVVKKSREFVCALITPGSGSSEFGELRLLGIEGAIVSPQHIFVHPDGKKILLRKQYWSHGKGEPAVKALLAMMDDAQSRLSGAADAVADKPEDAAPTGEGRAEWIRKKMGVVVTGRQEDRIRAIDQLLRSDKAGDCKTPVILLLAEHRKNTELIVDLIRGLGRDQLIDAAEPITVFLAHRKEEVRGNAAVTLEYIGSRDPKVIAALRKAVGKERNVDVANHMYRALGRCGVDDSKTRSLLLKKCSGARSERASYGPAIGLAYFDSDPKAARGMERILKKIGSYGGSQNTVKRGVYCWTLAWIRDEKSGAFVRSELLDKLKNVKAFWVGGLKSYYRNVARHCERKEDGLAGITAGVRGFVGFAKRANPEHYNVEAKSLMDKYRKGREEAGFTPKGEYLLGDGGDA